MPTLKQLLKQLHHAQEVSRSESVLWQLAGFKHYSCQVYYGSSQHITRLMLFHFITHNFLLTWSILRPTPRQPRHGSQPQPLLQPHQSARP